jgi:photosystem II stability/assembly factor-like uncharacterized protein
MRRSARLLAVFGLAVVAACAGSLEEPPLVFSSTWISEDAGWVLAADAGCSATCAAVVYRTGDGGETWEMVEGAEPRLDIDRGDEDVALEPHLRFANERDGWMVTPDLWSTHDGGVTWTLVELDGVVTSLETELGSVHAVVLDSTGFRIWTSPVTTDDFVPAPVVAPAGAGAAPSTDLVLADDRGWMVANNEVVTGGLILEDGAWSSFEPPCRDRFGPVELAASPTDVVALCNEGVAATVDAPGYHLYASDDGGVTFARELPLPDAARGAVFVLERPEEGALVLVTQENEAPATVSSTMVSSDDGATWNEPQPLTDGATEYLGFTTPTRGEVIVEDHLFLSGDRGLTWIEVLLPGI